MRILITGLASHWGGVLAQELEREPAVDAIVGVDESDPRHELRRTEFVRVGGDAAPLERIIRAAAIDTVVDTWLIPDAQAETGHGAAAPRAAATRAVAAAAVGPVRKLVVKASARVYGTSGRGAPAFFSEAMPPAGPAHELIELERQLAVTAASRPQLTVTVLRFAEAIGGHVRSAHQALLGLPAVPAILGFDPRWQVVHETDVVGVLRHAALFELPGAYNAAADGVLTLSEIASLLGKPLLPLLPPWGTGFAARQLRRVGLPVPVQLLRDLRHGRGLDNRRLKATGYAFRYTSREAVLELRTHQRVRPLLQAGERPYRYQREVEEFLRWSPSVRSAGAGATSGSPGGPADRLGPPARGRPGYAELTEDELLELIPSLAPAQARQLRDHEASGRGREAVLAALEHQLERP